MAVSLSDWDVSSGRYACLSQMLMLSRDPAKTPAKPVEHPELVADRVIAFAELVGRKNVIAGTDCAPGGRVRPQIAWAKQRALRRTPFLTLNFEPLNLERAEGPIRAAR